MQDNLLDRVGAKGEPFAHPDIVCPNCCAGWWKEAPRKHSLLSSYGTDSSGGVQRPISDTGLYCWECVDSGDLQLNEEWRQEFVTDAELLRYMLGCRWSDSFDEKVSARIVNALRSVDEDAYLDSVNSYIFDKAYDRYREWLMERL